MAKLKIAILGTGKVTEGNYLPSLIEEPDVTLGYYNRTQAKAEACAARFGGQVFPSVAALVDWQPDTVFVLTGEKDRYDAACALLEHRPPRLFFEKPLVAHHGQENVTEQDFTDGQKILLQAAAQGCETAMIFNYRFFEQSQAARHIAAERDFGEVRNISGLVHYACWSHCIDLVHFFAGPIAEISALQGRGVRSAGWMSAQDVTAAFRTESDATGTLIGTAALEWKYPLYELTFNFAHGRIHMQDLDGEMSVMDSQHSAVETYRVTGGDKSRWDQYNLSFKKSIAAYLQSIRDHQSPPVPGRFGLLELQVEAALKRSITEERPVKLAEEFPLNL